MTVSIAISFGGAFWVFLIGIAMIMGVHMWNSNIMSVISVWCGAASLWRPGG